MNELWNKPVNELTAKESVKLQLQITAVMVGGLMVGAGIAAGVTQFKNWRNNRKNFENKLED